MINFKSMPSLPKYVTSLLTKRLQKYTFYTQTDKFVSYISKAFNDKMEQLNWGIDIPIVRDSFFQALALILKGYNKCYVIVIYQKNGKFNQSQFDAEKQNPKQGTFIKSFIEAGLFKNFVQNSSQKEFINDCLQIKRTKKEPLIINDIKMSKFEKIIIKGDRCKRKYRYSKFPNVGVALKAKTQMELNCLELDIFLMKYLGFFYIKQNYYPSGILKRFIQNYSKYNQTIITTLLFQLLPTAIDIETFLPKQPHQIMNNLKRLATKRQSQIKQLFLKIQKIQKKCQLENLYLIQNFIIKWQNYVVNIRVKNFGCQQNILLRLDIKNPYLQHWTIERFKCKKFQGLLLRYLSAHYKISQSIKWHFEQIKAMVRWAEVAKLI